MISSILVSEKNRKELLQTVGIGLAVSAFCIFFFIIYDLFSHGVRSPFMTYLFAWPLLLIAVPAGVMYLIAPIPGPSLLSTLFWHTGVAALTVSSLLRGVFEIAGNSSLYQHLLMFVGFAMLGIGAVLYFLGIYLKNSAISE